jgi:PKD repeat protein
MEAKVVKLLPVPQLGALALLLLAPAVRPSAAQTTNRPPVAATTGPYVSGSRNVTVDGRPSSDPDGDALTYAWDFGDATTGVGSTVKHEYPKRGTFTVKLVVTDSKGVASAPVTTTVLVHWPPDANAGGPYTAAEGAALQLDGSLSVDKDGDLPLTYAWTYGDGKTGTGVRPTTTYAQSGTFTAGLIVTDSRGAVSSKDNGTVTITNVPPTVTVNPLPASAAAGSAVTLTGSFTDPAPQDGPWTRTFEWGDGTPNTTGSTTSLTSISAPHTYATGGSYTVVLRVKDKDLGEGLAQRLLSVSGGTSASPVAAAGGPYAAGEGALVPFDGRGSTGTGLSYAWVFGDGSTGSGSQPTKSYAQDGSYPVALTVTDANGVTSRATATATIANVAPTVTATPGAGPFTIGAPATLTGTIRDPGPDSPWGWTIDWGDGTPNSAGSATGTGPATSTSFTASHTYTAARSYTVAVRVTDKDGGTGTAPSQTITVGAATNGSPVAALRGAPYSGAEGAEVSLDGSTSSDPDGDALTYAWNFGDGTTGAGATPAHTYAQNGSYTVTLTVSDGKGGTSAPVSTTASISNVAPAVVVAPTPASATVNSAVTLTGSFTDPGADGPWTYTVVWGDGTANATGTLATAATGITATHTYTAAGTPTVIFRVAEAGAAGVEGSASRTLTVDAAANQRPVASIAAGPYTGTEGGSVTFTGSGTDPDGDALTYAWSFGDGTTGVGTTPAHTYAQNGSYTVSLTVSDGRGGTSVAATATATIANVAPNADASLSAASIAVGSAVTLSGSFTDPGAQDGPWNWTIEWGDGAANNSTGTATSGTPPISASHTYATAGSYTVVFHVREAGPGGVEDTAQVALTVTAAPNRPPVARISGVTLPYTGVEGASLSPSGSTSSDPDNDALTYAWDFGDGTTSAVATPPAHTYAQDGTYTVALTVSDGKGGSHQATGTVTLTNVAPTASASLSAASIPAGSSVTLTGGFTDPGTQDGPWPYTIVWGDGSTNTGNAASPAAPITASHTYASVGSYTVVLRVREAGPSGVQDTVANALTVTAPPTAAQVVLLAGDIADCSRNTDEQTAAILARTEYKDATIFTVGDNAYPDATLTTLRDCYGPTWGKFLDRTWPVVGNHEYTSSTPNAEGYHAYFGAKAGEVGKAYYTVTLGDWQIFVLNSEISLKANTPQEIWLRSELAKSKKPCTLAIWHKPRFYSGSVATEATSQKALWTALYNAGAELIIGGHHHNYERFAPQNADGVADAAKGIRQFVVGTGGKDFASFGTPAPNSELRDKTAFGVLKLTLTSTGYTWQFLPAGTSTFTDSGAGTCH